MIRAEDQTMKRLAALTGAMLPAADYQSRPARRVVVSLADRKLAVVEAGRVVKIFDTVVDSRTRRSNACSNA